MLVKVAGVGADALHEDLVIIIALGAFTAISVNREVAVLTVAVQSINVEDLVRSAPITHGLVAPADLHRHWFAAGTVVVIPTVSVVV